MRTLLPLALLFFTISLQAQTFSRVKIHFDDHHKMIDLANMGLDVDHGHYKPHRYYIGELADYQIESVKAQGFATEILVEDLQAELMERNAHYHEHGPQPVVSQRHGHCGNNAPAQYETPENYEYGTMGGYYTLQEMYDELDKMEEMYPDIFKARAPITTAYTTHENRPIYWVKISDDPDVEDASEPDVLYTALHHAREPNSLSQMIFYLWYLLENYETDEEVKYLVDNVEMYFVPCLNPDGYVYNETTDPSGGGFWRKNRRDNGDGTFGVDLNRNYDYQWGFNNTGSSPNTNSQTYRGPSPASEPETRMISEFCEAHEFLIAANYHTHGNLLIYPWGYTDGASPDHESFTEISGFMKQDNGFLAGFGSQTVGYTVNGTSDDWMYGEQTTKNKILSMTPEVGPEFWPSQAEIDNLNKSCMKMNLNMAHLVLNFGILRPATDQFVSSFSGKVDYGLRKIGLQQGLLQVSLEPVSSNIASVGSVDNYGLFHLEETTDDISFSLSPSIAEGELVQFNVVLDNGFYQWKESVEMIYTANSGTAMAEPGDDLSQWAGGTDWQTTTEHFHSAPNSITDSEGGNYSMNNLNIISLEEDLDMEGVVDVRLSFWARWDIEEDEDYAQVWGSFNGGTSIPLCGKYTEVGTDEQDFDEPVYDGQQDNWVREEIDLTEYINADGELSVDLEFRMVSDEMVQMDGFYFDDLTFTVIYEEGPSSDFSFDSEQFSVTSRPNPARDYVILDIESEVDVLTGLKLQVFNTLGQMVASQNVQGKVLEMNTSNWTPGVYHYRISDGKQGAPAGRFVVE